MSNEERTRAQTQINYDDVMKSFEKKQSMPLAMEQRFSLDQMQKDTEDFVNLNNSGDQDIINQHDSIFNQLATDEILKSCSQQPSCSVCSSQFSMIKKKKQCQFCGQCVCKEHARKQRANPQRKEEFYPVCDVCDDKYIRYEVQLAFILKREKLVDESHQLDLQAQDIIAQIKVKQEKLESIKVRSVKQTGEIKSSQTHLLFKNSKLANEVKSLQRQEQELKEQLTKYELESKQLEEHIREKEGSKGNRLSRLQQMDSEFQQIDGTIRNTLKDIEQVEFNIRSSKRDSKTMDPDFLFQSAQTHQQQSNGQKLEDSQAEYYDQAGYTEQVDYVKDEQQQQQPKQENDQQQDREGYCVIF